MQNLQNLFEKPLQFINVKKPFDVDIALILGSGLGGFADALSPLLSINTCDIPGYPVSTVAGHSGKIHFVEAFNKKILVFQGRIHFYEGYTLAQCLLPVEISKLCNAKAMIITNAAGGINPHFSPGDLMLTSGFNSMLLRKEIAELFSPGSVERRNALVGLADSQMYNAIQRAGLEAGISLKEGVYFYTKGPNYETPAEIHFIRATGADAVGMSSVHEALYAIHHGIDVGLISCISNFAAGISGAKLYHGEVTETANRVKLVFEDLIKRAIALY